MKSGRQIILLIVLVLIVSSTSALAHRLQPAYLEITEQNTGTFNVLWKRPLVGNKPMDIYPRFPESCSNLTEPVLRPSDSSAVERWLIDCGASGLAKKTIVIDGLVKTVTDTLLRIELADGSMHTTVLQPNAPTYIVPENVRLVWFFKITLYSHI